MTERLSEFNTELLKFDKLVIAVGSVPKKHLRGQEHVLSIKTDIETISSQLKRPDRIENIVILGGGPLVLKPQRPSRQSLRAR